MTPNIGTDQRDIAGPTPAQRTTLATDDSQDREIRRAVLLLRLETIGKLSRTVRTR